MCPIDTLTAEGVYYVTRKLRFQLYKDECFRKPTLLMLHLHIPVHTSPEWIRESFLGDPPGLSPSQPGELSRSTPALVKRMVDNGINAHLLKGSSKSDPGDYWDGTPSPSLLASSSFVSSAVVFSDASLILVNNSSEQRQANQRLHLRTQAGRGNCISELANKLFTTASRISHWKNLSAFIPTWKTVWTLPVSWAILAPILGPSESFLHASEWQ